MFRSIFTNSFGILFSRILGFIRDLLTASILGANIYSDIFFVAFKLPNLFRRIFAEGAFVQSFLPSFTRSKHKALFSIHIFLVFLLFLIVMSMSVNLFSQEATRAIAVGFDAQSVEIAAPFVAICFWYLPLIFMVTFLSTFLHYKNHFATTAFGTGLLNIALIIALLLAAKMDNESVVLYLSYGVVGGGIAQLLLHIFTIKVLNLHKLLLGGIKYYRAKKHKVVKESREFYKKFFPAVWGNSTAQIAAFLDTWLASFLASGAISYLYYANRVFQLPLALFAIAVSIALFPRIARHIRHLDKDKAYHMMYRGFILLSIVLSVSTAIGIIFAEQIVWLLFERGAFEAQDTLNTTLILQMYLIGLLPFGLSKLFLLWLYAHEQQNMAAKIATLSLLCNIILSLAFIYPLGAAGLALSSSISGFVTLVATLRAIGKDELRAMARGSSS